MSSKRLNCDTVLDGPAACSVGVDRHILDVQRMTQVAVSADRSRQALTSAGSPRPGNQVPDQSSTGKLGWRS